MTSPVQLQHALALFPTWVHLFQLEGHETLNRAFERRIRKIRKREPLWKGIASPWQCAPDLHRDPELTPLVEAIHAASAQVLSHLDMVVDRLEITAMWANILARGEFHRPHVHGNNLISGVYHVTDGSRIVFLNPNPAAGVIHPRLRQDTIANANEWQIDAVAGRMILFPSWLRHYVQRVDRDERMSIAFNVMVRGEMDAPDSLQGGRF